MKPYYQEDGITIYHGDCREVLPMLTGDMLFDALITDPPYGVELGIGNDKRGGAHGLAKGSYTIYQDTEENFRDVVLPAIQLGLVLSIRAAIFPGPRLREFPAYDALGGIHCPAALGRTAWGFTNLIPIAFYGVCPQMKQGNGSRPTVFTSNESSEDNGHPCPKPEGWMRWLVARATFNNELLCDPFMGSGTTLRAAKDLGRRAIGIEIEEKYCEIAAKRLSQKVFDFK